MTGARSGAIFQVGDLLNNTYRIEAILGRGGTSEVYRGRSEISGHLVALKALRSEFSANEDFITLMRREEEIREIRHDAIVRYFHNQRTADGVVFLIMDYVDGPGLDRKMKEGGMSAADLLTVAGRVAEGLQAAHAKNIVHRDLSPDNIILRNGDPADAVIIDFGIAKDTNPGAETVVGNEFAGKYAYAAPEQLSGQSDARTDIYSLGALLLATFRGASPSVGKNPLEVIEGKSLPLDTTGVPEPLKSLIDRMTAPDPADRFASAAALLEGIRGGGVAAMPEVDSDATVIAPRPVPAKSAVKPAPAPAEKTKGRGGLFAVLAFVLIAAAGGGAYLSGMFDSVVPSLPVAEPYTLTMARAEGGSPQARGHVPSEEVSAALGQRIAAMGGHADLTLARGDIDPDWGAEMLQLFEVISPLPEWRIEVEGNRVAVTGVTEDRAEHQVLNGITLPGALIGGISVELRPRVLEPRALSPVLASFADCGELRLVNPPMTGYPTGAEVAVTGKVASATTRQGLIDALQAAVGNRRVSVDLEELNPTLCLIDQALPAAPPGGFAIGFGNGETGSRNPSGRFVVGQNPVIDITIPADATDGYLYVSALDVSGNVFHLLPNVYIEDNSLAALRGGQEGPVLLRVAYSLKEAEDAGGRKLAFNVDDSALGKTEIVVIHADAPILNGTRPITESAEGFAQAIRERSGPVRSLDSRILVTAAQ